jgi:hypothetical protein
LKCSVNKYTMADSHSEKRQALYSALRAGCSLEEFQSAVAEERELFVKNYDFPVLGTALLVGRFDVADWILDHFAISVRELCTPSTIGDLLRLAAGQGRLDACRWIEARSNRSEFVYYDFGNAMYEAMYYKRAEIIEWLHTVHQYPESDLATYAYKIESGLDKRCRCHDNCK